MNQLRAMFALLALLFCIGLKAQEKPSLELVETVSLPGVVGSWDHFAVDLPGSRLFLASEGAALVEVFDLRTTKLIHTIKGFKMPHAIFLRQDLNKLFITDGEASEIKVFDGTSYELVDAIKLTIDADPILYDPTTHYLYVVNGGREAHTPYCLLSIVDTTSNRKLTDITFNVNRLESMAIERSGTRLFVNMAATGEIGVLDRNTRKVIAVWPITEAKENGAMVLDETSHRLFVTTTTPPKIVVLDSDSGKVIAGLSIAKHPDDLSYDALHKRLYVPCGEGFISVYQQINPNDYKRLGDIPTAPGGKNGIWIPELNKYYVSIPQQDAQPAQVRVYKSAS